jgi:hypothetical protein
MTAAQLYGSKRREALVRLPIGELAGWHLVALCGACRKERIVSIDSLVTRYGPEPPLARITPRFRCALKQCRQPPLTLRLRNRFPVQPGPPLVDIMLMDGRQAGR